MTTVRTLITQAVKDLGAIAVGETPTADEIQDGLEALNQLLGTWQTEALMVYAMRQEVFTLPTGQAFYTIGAGGDINTARPVSVDSAYMRSSNTNDLEIYVCRSYQDYADIVSKGVNSTLITAVYLDATFPLGKLYVWPQLSDNTYSLVLWMRTVLAEYASINDDVSLPPGYERALRTNLAVELAPRYGREISAVLASLANESKAQLKRMNVDIPTLSFDRGLGGSGITFNYLTGQPT
jgi:hypothetical protein